MSINSSIFYIDKYINGKYRGYHVSCKDVLNNQYSLFQFTIRTTIQSQRIDLQFLDNILQNYTNDVHLYIGYIAKLGRATISNQNKIWKRPNDVRSLIRFTLALFEHYKRDSVELTEQALKEFNLVVSTVARLSKNEIDKVVRDNKWQEPDLNKILEL